MTDIDPAAGIELHTVDEHVIVRVPLAGPVTEVWVLYYQRLARATGVPCKPRHILTGPGLPVVEDLAALDVPVRAVEPAGLPRVVGVGGPIDAVPYGRSGNRPEFISRGTEPMGTRRADQTMAAPATLMAMKDNAQPPGPGPGDDRGVHDTGSRLAVYEARTEIPLDLLALLTLWLVVVPPWDFGHDVGGIVWPARIALSVVYGIDLAIRGVLARRPVRYAFTHPVALAAVLYPPVRVVFSVRLVRSMFRRGHLGRFLLAASVLVLNGAVIVYLFERHAPGSNIHTLGESVWWSFVTVTTVGYGDYTPVTVDGRVMACFIMAIGLLTLAVVTAQVASSFVSQGSSRSRRGPQTEAAPSEVTLADLDRRLARIEELLLAVAPSPPRAAEAPDGESGSK